MRIENLGCGVQSTCIFLMACEGEIEPIDYAIFADTQEETRAVYDHFAWLRTVSAPAPIILTGTAGRIGDDLTRGVNTTGQRFATIPAFTAPGEPDDVTKEMLVGCETEKRKVGKLRRQCTKEYKTQVVERIIRREIFKLKSRQRFPKGTLITQIFGISTDEAKRAIRITARVDATGWAKASFPLLDLGMSRDDCLAWLKPRVPHQTPESSCVFCPFKDAESWLEIKKDPVAWARAVEVDAGLREPGAIAQRGMDQPIYIHRSAIPLPMVDLDAEVVKERDRHAKRQERTNKKQEATRRPLFEMMECGDGMCGN